ncbi:MAG TPA: hypothetical protein V6D47_07640 [Oscillatoriaceae cyanobacterium]
MVLIATHACALIQTSGASLPTPAATDRVEIFSALAAGDHATEMYGPYRLAIDSQGNVWVMYINSNKLAELGSDGQMLGIREVGGNHVAIAVDAHDDIWLLDSDAMVTKLDAKATLQGRFAVGKNPQDIALDQQGNVWVTSSGDDSLTELSPEGKAITHASFENAPGNLAIDGAGNIWVDTSTDHSDKNLIKVGPDGKEQAAYSLGYTPYAIVGDPGGGVWTSDPNGTIHRYDAGGDQFAANPLGGVIYGLACTPTGFLWLTLGGDRDEIMELSPKVTVVAKAFQTGHNPNDLALDASGRVWFLNQLDGAVGRITLAPSPPPSISPQAYNQLSFRITAPVQGTEGLVTSMGHSLQLAVQFGTRSAPVSWRIADADRDVATIDDNGRLTPLQPGAVQVIASVEGDEAAARIVVTSSPAPDAKPVRLPDGILASAPQSGACLINDQTTWKSAVKHLFAPLPGPSPLPVPSIDFSRRSVLLLAYNQVSDENEGAPIVAEVATGTAPVVRVDYSSYRPYGGAVAEGEVVNAIQAFNIPKVPNDCPVNVSNVSFHGTAVPLSPLDF